NPFFACRSTDPPPPGTEVPDDVEPSRPQFYCSLDGGPTWRCAKLFDTEVLTGGLGPHVVTLQSADPAGNMTPPAEFHWTKTTDDGALSVADGTVTEVARAVTFAVNLDVAMAHPVTVDYATEAGT